MTVSKEITVIKGKDLTWDMVAADPERYRELSNGAIFDNLSKKIVKAPPNDRQYITRENASELINHRWDQARKAVHVGMVNASPSNVTEYDAISRISENMTTIASEKDSRTAVDAATWLMKSGGFAPDRGKNGDNMPASGAQINISGPAMEQIGEILARMTQDK